MFFRIISRTAGLQRLPRALLTSSRWKTSKNFGSPLSQRLLVPQSSTRCDTVDAVPSVGGSRVVELWMSEG